MFSAKPIANYFLELAMTCDQSISLMKLQALVYYAHGWHAGYTGRALINEKVQAGPYGLVISSLYREFNRFGSGPINSKAFECDALGVKEAPPPRDPDTQKLLRAVFHGYASYSDIQLSEMVHATDAPWNVTWRGPQACGALVSHCLKSPPTSRPQCRMPSRGIMRGHLARFRSILWQNCAAR